VDTSTNMPRGRWNRRAATKQRKRDERLLATTLPRRGNTRDEALKQHPTRASAKTKKTQANSNAPSSRPRKVPMLSCCIVPGQESLVGRKKQPPDFQEYFHSSARAPRYRWLDKKRKVCWRGPRSSNSSLVEIDHESPTESSHRRKYVQAHATQKQQISPKPLRQRERRPKIRQQQKRHKCNFMGIDSTHHGEHREREKITTTREKILASTTTEQKIK